jgi:phage host-nuclease inhibitor protein Gam
MTLRLTAAEAEALRRKAAAQQRSMQDVAREAIRLYTSSTERVAEIAAQVVQEDQALLRRLAEP